MASFRKVMKYLEEDKRKEVIDSMVLSVLRFGLEWSGRNDNNLKRLQRSMNQALRMMTNRSMREPIRLMLAKTKLMNMKLPYSQLVKCPELKENPFRKRICKIFSSDGLGDLTFNEFMLLFSSLCEHTPRDIKLHYAFNIYDFDGDKYIGVADIEQV